MTVRRAITKEDWSAIEQQLQSLYSIATLYCDGYKIELVLARVDQFKNRINLFVNGKVEGKWFLEDCEERRRFFCQRSKTLLTAKERAAYKKIYRRKKDFERFVESRKYFYHEPQWKSFRSLKSHLIKHNKVIEVVEGECDGEE
ncbi:hypothetical protein [Paenibacillus sanguinis]|uniref:hypothetical protein n=1 Tax=Paenibacillus sanguinis TaxID=225906 RepID=UPI00037F7DBD|nr:hypothetical protein [Paenibacillus sanguinis]